MEQLIKMSNERMLNIVKLLKDGFSPTELINSYGYNAEEVFTSIKIMSYLKSNRSQYRMD